MLADGERWQTPVTRTFGELAGDVHRAAGALHELGVCRGDAVAVISVNCAELLSVLLAAEAAGIFAPINPDLSVEHAAELVRLSGAGVIVASGPELEPRVWAHAREIAAQTGARALLALRPTGAAGTAPALEPLEGTEVAYVAERMAQADDGGLPGTPPASGDVASYLHTGGTTGTPKLAARTHANEVANAWMMPAPTSSTGQCGVRGAAAVPHQRAGGDALSPLLRGQHVVWAGPLGYRDQALFANFWKIVERYRISAMSGVPTVYAVLAQLPVDADISSLKLPIVGAAPLPRRSATRSWPAPVSRCARATGSPRGRARAPAAGPAIPALGPWGSACPTRRPAPSRSTRRPVSGPSCPTGEVGTLVLRGPNIFAGYLVRGPSATELRAGGKVRDGWLDTGDLASVDADGYIRLVGRAKDLIIRGGHNIDPAAIEDALLEHPAVTAAAAVGRPDAHAGEVPVAFVTVAPAASSPRPELKAWAAEHVSERAAAPKHVEIVDEIPLTAVGKPYKPELRRRAAEQAAREALAGNAITDRVSAGLVDGQVEVQVPHSPADAEVGETLSQYAWRWRLV